MKMGWYLMKRRDDLWVRVIRNKYKCGDDLLSKINPKIRGSNLWARIKATWDKVKEGSKLVNEGRDDR